MNTLRANIENIEFAASEDSLKLNVNLEISSGEIAVITGATGSGKTSCLRCLSGVIPHVIEADVYGGIFWNGVDIHNSGNGNVTPRPGTMLVAQNPFYSYAGSIWRMQKNNGDDNESGSLIVQRMKNAKSFQDLSAGEKQRVNLQTAFKADPEILLLDEPFGLLDDKGIETLMNLLTQRKQNSRGITIIAEHRTEIFDSLADKIIHIDNHEKDINLNSDFGMPDFSEKLHFNMDNGNRPLVSLRNIQFRKNGRQILNGIDFDISAGEVIGISGQNGSGKTTLGMIITGYLKPDKGEVIFNPKNIRRGMLLEDPQSQFLCDTVKDEVLFSSRNFNISDDLGENLLKTMNLGNIQNKSPFRLSHGQQERTVIASMLGNNPELIVLDEPTQGQDNSGMKRVSSLILNLKKAHRGVVVISHDLDFLNSIADKIYKLNEGALMEVG